MKQLAWVLIMATISGAILTACGDAGDLGVFESSGDVGEVLKNGSVAYDAGNQSYLVSGGGENMWFEKDAFYFVWQKASGDVSLAAAVELLESDGHAHRKAGLIIRQTLDADAPYASAALHGDGLVSLQYREIKGGPTREIQSGVAAPKRLRIEKEGEYISMSLAGENETFQSAGGNFRMTFTEPFYVGLGVCAHDDNALEKARFSQVELVGEKAETVGESVLESTLETIDIAAKNRRAVHHARAHFEAPNWSRDGEYFIFNQEGRLYTLPVSGGAPKLLDTDFATRCNNDHGISPDGTRLVISDQSQGDGTSLMYTLPISGGAPKLVTELGPSYWHGWSPDGKMLAYCAERNGNYDVYAIPVEGGEEIRLTDADGLDDGPDYSPDGEYIYFNSVRTGTMQIWRMKADGSDEEQMTFDDYNDWFPHPSPDGKWIVFLSYEPEVEGHPANKDVMLRLMPAGGGEIEVLAKFFGGQGTINVPSWSPDSKQVAFVSYRLVR